MYGYHGYYKTQEETLLAFHDRPGRGAVWPAPEQGGLQVASFAVKRSSLSLEQLPEGHRSGELPYDLPPVSMHMTSASVGAVRKQGPSRALCHVVCVWYAGRWMSACLAPDSCGQQNEEAGAGSP